MKSRFSLSSPLIKRGLIGLALVAWVGVVITIGVLNSQEGTKKSQQVYSSALQPESNSSLNFSGLKLLGRVSNIDIVNYKYTIHWDLLAWGAMASTSGGSTATPSDIPSVSFLLNYDNIVKNYTAGQVMAPFDQTTLFSAGDTNSYPFDAFTDYATIFATSTGAAGASFIPISLEVNGALQSYSISFSITDPGNGSVIGVNQGGVGGVSEFKVVF